MAKAEVRMKGKATIKVRVWRAKTQKWEEVK